MRFEPFEIELDGDEDNVITVSEDGLELEGVLVEWDGVRDFLARVAERHRKSVRQA